MEMHTKFFLGLIDVSVDTVENALGMPIDQVSLIDKVSRDRVLTYTQRDNNLQYLQAFIVDNLSELGFSDAVQQAFTVKWRQDTYTLDEIAFILNEQFQGERMSNAVNSLVSDMFGIDNCRVSNISISSNRAKNSSDNYQNYFDVRVTLERKFWV